MSFFLLQLNCSACRFATSCAYYGLTLNVASVGGNIYLNTLIMGAVIIPVYPLVIYLSNKAGRRNLISWSFILSGLFCTSMYFIPKGVILFLLRSVADPDQAFGGAVKLGSARKVFTCLNTKVCLRQSWVSHKSGYVLSAKKWLFLLVEICDFSGNNHSLKTLYIIN